jgi:hypothetical protein
MQRVRSRDQVPGINALRVDHMAPNAKSFDAEQGNGPISPGLTRGTPFPVPPGQPTFLPKRELPQLNATAGGEIAIISPIALILNNRC